MKDGGWEAVIAFHHHKSFLQGGPSVVCGHSLAQIIDERCARVEKDTALLHYPDAPVHVRTEPVFQVVLGSPGNLRPCPECLMADQHPVFKTPPVQILGGLKPPHPEELPIPVNKGGLPIDYVGIFAFHHCRNLAEGLLGMKAVPRIEENQVISRRQGDTLVHRIIQPPVRL